MYCNLESSSKGLGNPGKKNDNKDMFSDADDLMKMKETLVKDKKRITEFRGMAATANYLGADRCDMQFAAKELCRSMSAPTGESFCEIEALSEIPCTCAGGDNLLRKPETSGDFRCVCG